jgi:hypothetical protein
MAHGGRPEHVAEEDRRCHSEDDVGHATLQVGQQDRHCAMLVAAVAGLVVEPADRLELPRVQVQEAAVQRKPEQESEGAIVAALGEQTSIVLGPPRR